MTAIFVTSSGTDVGKTFVTVRLLDELRAAGRRARALKPIASGFDPSRPGDSDPGRLLRAQGLALSAANLDAVSPWRFAAPLSPDMAAAREGNAIPFDALVEFCSASSTAEITLIEGIGGVMVPLDATHTVLDWIAALKIPALLVVGGYLGTLSHTLTAAAALHSRGCELAGVVVDESPDQPVTTQETAAALARFLTSTPIVCLPRSPMGPAPRLLQLLDRLLDEPR